MVTIRREPERAADSFFDFIVVGGGIYGAMIALEGAARGLRPLLLERSDFGGATSFNSLRIVHGGLRYLQSLDLSRFRESVNDRRWWLGTFPELVFPLPVLMPLYSKGLRRKSVLRAALFVNDLLSARRNRGVPERNRLPGGRIAGIRETLEHCPSLTIQGLKGGAIWFDASMPDSHRLLMEVLRWFAGMGGVALNYVEATGIVTHAGRVTGIQAVDRESERKYEFKSPVVFNATGPWAGTTARAFAAPSVPEFRPSVAWNLLLDAPPPSECAAALTPPAGGPTYFAHPWKGRLLLGTGHVANHGRASEPTNEQIDHMLLEASTALSGMPLRRSQVVRVFAGVLPAVPGAKLDFVSRPEIVDHGKAGGPHGLLSVIGVKFTTAPSVARQVLDMVFGSHQQPILDTGAHPAPARGWESLDVDELYVGRLRSLVDNESVVHLADLVFRRTTLWEHTSRAEAVLSQLCDLFPWDAERRRRELEAVQAELGV